MPELIEVELYRTLAERAVGRSIIDVQANDAWFCRNGTTPNQLEKELKGLTVLRADRHGKLLMMRLGATKRETTTTLGLRFGMTGRLLINGTSNIETLLYSSDRNDSAWDRFGLTFHDGTTMTMRDPRRLGGVELAPNVADLGPDALTITLAQFRGVLSSTSMPVKAALLDQSKIAGVGNLIADETLWRAGLLPAKVSRALSPEEVDNLYRVMRRTIRTLTKRGGSHLGDLMDERVNDGKCPTDGELLRKVSIGGRTTWFCPKHQV
jgi:formamidopyrimidine-DNA glycosylase